MKIAVPYENGAVYGHFGHTAQFKIYTAENGVLTDARVLPTNGSGHSALAGFLTAAGVDTLICGGIGAGAKQALTAANITVYGGVSGAADAAVVALLSGTLAYDPNARCDHHDHADGEHSCGEHSCH
ncbi:MAG: dinitrogenase iron-molybdenum cofactor biosynthesis protein [Oscillospiraceae bacterium]|nr:dinitrogenase iron-molybdenum cofactor biosynthesis protein [Oscillospiraceae bacterium]